MKQTKVKDYKTSANLEFNESVSALHTVSPHFFYDKEFSTKSF